MGYAVSSLSLKNILWTLEERSFSVATQVSRYKENREYESSLASGHSIP
jgi:hypothetical protein